MGLFDMFSKSKKTVQCSMCNSTINAGSARQIDGNTYCQKCFDRILAHASQSRNPGNGGGYGGNTGSYSGNGGSYSGNGGSYGGNGGNGSNFTGNTGNMPVIIRDIKTAFEAADLRFRVDHVGDQWELVAGVSGKANSYQVKFITKDGGKDDVAMRVFNLVHINPGNRGNVLATLNGFQRKYRFLRYTIDKDDDVKIEYDLHTCGADIGKAATEMLLRTMKIVDDIYPELMRQVWG